MAKFDSELLEQLDLEALGSLIPPVVLEGLVEGEDPKAVAIISSDQTHVSVIGADSLLAGGDSAERVGVLLETKPFIREVSSSGVS